MIQSDAQYISFFAIKRGVASAPVKRMAGCVWLVNEYNNAQ